MYSQSFLLAFVLLIQYGLTLKETCPNIKRPLEMARKRRHLAFPRGSTVSMTTSVVKSFMTNVPSGWFFVVDANIQYDLPDAKIVAAHARRKLHHRQKREFWDTLEGALELLDLNGRSCVIRSICEAKTSLAPPGRSLLHDILRLVFTAPLHEEDFNEEIFVTHNELLEPNFCDRQTNCPFSVINFVLDLNKPPN